MKVFINSLFLAAFVFSQSNCSSGVSSNNGNLANANANNVIGVVIPAAENSPAVVENKAPEVVPTFTNADEALAGGSKYLDDNKTENAIDALKQATKLNPELAEAHFKLGIAYSLQENENEALQKVDEEEKPTKPVRVKAGKGREEVIPITSNSGKSFENAAKAYEKITRKNPKDADAFFNLGRSYNKINKDKEAEKALRQAVKLNSDEAEYQTELGAILNKLAQYDEAVTVLKKVVDADPENLRAVDLLEKAEAGKKRTNFGIKPKLPTDIQKGKEARPRGATKPREETESGQPMKEAPPAPPAKPGN